MPTFTTNFGFEKPDPGQTNWAGIMNTTLDDIDAEIASATGSLSPGNYTEEVVVITGTSGTLSHTPSLILDFTDNGKSLRKVGASPEYSITGPNITLHFTPGGTNVFVAKYWH